MASDLVYIVEMANDLSAIWTSDSNSVQFVSATTNGAVCTIRLRDGTGTNRFARLRVHQGP